MYSENGLGIYQMFTPKTATQNSCSTCGCIGPHFCTGGQKQVLIYAVSGDRFPSDKTAESINEVITIIESIIETGADND